MRELVVLVGPNGAGKTNLLEAISFLAPGRGLRRATLDEVAFSRGRRLLGGRGGGRGRARPRDARHRHRAARRRKTRASHAHMPHRPRAGRLGGGLRRSSAHRLADAGDGRPVRRAGLRAAALPRSAGARGRRARIRAASTRWSARLRSRNRLLEEQRPDPHWLDAVEHETAELAVAVAAARAETVRAAAGRAGARPRSGFAVSLGRDRARRLDRERAARAARDRGRGRYRAVLRDNRARDAAAGRTSTGRISPTSK